MFVGPVVAVPLILLACHGIGYGREISPFMRFVMNFSYLRHSMEGLVETLYGYNRADTICPPTEIICVFKNAKFLRESLGFENQNYWLSICFLVFYYVICTSLAFVLIKDRLSGSNGRTNRLFQYINQMMVKYLNFTSYKY